VRRWTRLTSKAYEADAPVGASWRLQAMPPDGRKGNVQTLAPFTGHLDRGFADLLHLRSLPIKPLYQIQTQ
jgi:hypothetical protein